MGCLFRKKKQCQEWWSSSQTRNCERESWSSSVKESPGQLALALPMLWQVLQLWRGSLPSYEDSRNQREQQRREQALVLTHMELRVIYAPHVSVATAVRRPWPSPSYWVQVLLQSEVLSWDRRRCLTVWLERVKLNCMMCLSRLTRKHSLGISINREEWWALLTLRVLSPTRCHKTATQSSSEHARNEYWSHCKNEEVRKIAPL